METTYTWEDDPDGTRMTLRNRGEPAGFARVTGDGGRAPLIGVVPLPRTDRRLGATLLPGRQSIIGSDVPVADRGAGSSPGVRRVLAFRSGYSTVRSIVNEPANSPLPKSNPSTTV
jgi:hypothetical protein